LIKWWIFLFFSAVAAAAVGFSAVGRFLGRILEYTLEDLLPSLFF